MLLLNQIVTYGKLDKTFVAKPPDDGSQLAILSKTEVNSKLSTKFKAVTGNFNAQNIKERLLSAEEIEAYSDGNEYVDDQEN